jgi:hypothetical protein
MQLRAALAAVNTIDLRDGEDDVTARTVHLTDFDPATQPNPALHDVIATVYGLERQPFITRVYATNALMTDPLNPLFKQPGYIAIELYNPDPKRPINLSGYALATIQRPGTAQTTTPPNFNPTFIPWGSDPAWFGSSPPMIPPGGYLVIASSATPPPGVTLASPAVVVRNLVPPTGGGAIGNELMLFRPKFLDGNGLGVPSCSGYISNFRLVATPPPATPGPTSLTSQPQHLPYPAYHEGPIDASGNYTPNPADMVPLDSYDFTGMPPGPASPPTVWYYVRPNDPSPTSGKSWHFVYPGHYVVSETPRLIDGTLVGSPGPGITLGTPQASPAQAAFKDIPLQLNALDCAGPGVERPSETGPVVVAFPYGGFARNGDILQTPFIGSYRLEIEYPVASGNPAILEMNPVTIDSALALGLSQGPLFNEPVESQFQVPNVNTNLQSGLNDPICDSSGLPVENIGRFCPMNPSDLGPANAANPPLNDFAPAPPGGVSSLWLYHFGTRLFDYLTVQSPQQDYTPEADPGDSDIYLALNQNGAQPLRKAKYSPPGETSNTYSIVPSPVANATGGSAAIFNAEPSNPNSATEETMPTEGLININTAPWRVLAAVPWVGPDFPIFDGTPHGNRLAANVNIGLSIAYYRDVNDGSGHGHGPFRSIFELNNVPIYPTVSSTGIGSPYTLFRDLLKSGGTPYNQNQGNLTPGYDLKDSVVGDFRTKFTMMSRASNLVTTRSDSFTAYILLQGWRNAETPNATLAVQRRAALLIDRSGVTPVNASPSVNFVTDQ